MPVASLNRFTVPLGAGGGNNQGLLMPKLQYRFRVTLDQFGVGGLPSTELTKQVMSVSRPEITFDDLVIDVYNSRVKLLGKHKIGDIKFKVRDDASGNVSKKVGEQMQKQFDFFEQSGAASAIDYKFRMRVEILDGGNGAYDPVTLESFEYLGCYIKQITYAGGDYTKNDPFDIDMAISVDNVIQLETPGGAASGLGLDVGRVVRQRAGQGLVTAG